VGHWRPEFDALEDQIVVRMTARGVRGRSDRRDRVDAAGLGAARALMIEACGAGGRMPGVRTVVSGSRRRRPFGRV